MAKKDYYDILGVKKTATEEEMKKAYRALAKNRKTVSRRSTKLTRC
jgi:DnaJ-class molecular chaperone